VTQLATFSSLAELTEEFPSLLAGALGADTCGLIFPCSEEGSRGFARTERSCVAMPESAIANSLLGAASQSEMPLRLLVSELPERSKAVAKSAGISCILLAELREAEERCGMLYADHRQPGMEFSETDVQLVHVLATLLSKAVENLRLKERMSRELESLRWEVDSRHCFANIIGQSLCMQRLFSILQRVAASDVTVLVEGESGSGKELVARAIHAGGKRRQARFVAQNCAALPEHLLESELFGHVRGAFTGAHRDKKGLFEVAHGGTFLLDEIADMPPMLQVKLLRVLQDGKIRRVGGTDPIEVDVRIIAATNKPLEEEVRLGRFRSDLFYRLNVMRIELPPLRDRRDDIPLLAQHFLDRFSAEQRKSVEGFTQAAMELLVNYDWPGNVRELENEVERAVVLSNPGQALSAASLSDKVRSVDVAIHPPRPGVGVTLKDLVEDVERRVIVEVLNANKWNKSKTARILGLSRQGLLKKIARFDLTPEQD